ncbi:urease accessory protein UreD [Micromonospora echinospora]|uniref:Urease accessory protein UreD n=1 Tax=Micromonospora echinospora TaxID=1877 RepID=A0A1C4ZJP6_MICEC|nr:urease accessory protein UreD [Micromonospora echinospora]OZV81566.1 urease accessory protein UreD [Micromonospora echinospora]SCF33125.1 urease accessory protein [Micromonospora echinospora]
MFAAARVRASPDRHGGTVLADLHGEPPLVLRQVPDDHGAAVVYLVAGAAGPLGGDDLRLDIEVEAGAALRVRTLAASVALPGRSGAPSRTRVRALVHPGGSLDWLPEQLVAAAGCAHISHAEINLAAGATLTWREELVCGRHAEPSGDATVSMSVDHDGRALLRQSLAVGPAADGWAGPAVLGGARATGSLLQVGPAAAALPPVVRGTASRVPLAGGPAVLFTATADDAHTLREHLTSERWAGLP